MLTFVIFLPLAGAAAVVLLPKERQTWSKWVAALVAAIALALVVFLFIDYDRDAGGFQFIERATWLRSDNSDFKLHYAVGLDGLSLPLLLLTAFLGLVAVLISWRI